MQLSGSRVAVTGAAGFIGAHACRRLAAEGAEVVAIDVSPKTAERVGTAACEVVRADTTDPGMLTRALKGSAAILHTAALVSDWGEMERLVEVNVRGTRNVLDAAAAGGVPHVVHVSSVAVWGYEFSYEIGEDAPLCPCGIPYIDTKAASERLALRRGAAVVRPGDVYGPGSVPWVLRPIEAMRRGLFRLPGCGDGVMTPIYVDDLVDCLMRALESEQAAGHALTCHDGAPVRAQEFFSHYARMLGGENVPLLPYPLALASAAAMELGARVTGRPPLLSRAALTFVSRRAAYPNERARELLGWEPRVDLDEGMARTATWLREQGLID